MPRTGISRAVLDACDRFGPAVALTDGERSLSYAAFGAAIREWARIFGQHSDDRRVGFALPNSIDYAAALYGAAEAGCVPFLIDDSLSLKEKLAIAEDVGLDIIATPETPPESRHARLINGMAFLEGAWPSRNTPRLRPTTGVCRFTSGTSGRPKCLEFSHEAVLRAAETWRAGNRLGQDDIVLCLSGFYNGLAFNTSLTACFLSGARLSIYRGWASPSQVFRYATAQAATRLVGFPVFYQMMVRAGTQATQIPPSLTHFYSAASKLGDETRARLSENLGLSIINYYGIAETGPITHEPDPDRARGNGVALPDCEMRIGPAGVEVKTPYMASGYLNAPGVFEDRITQDGFYRTSDTGDIRDGRLVLASRTDNLIDVGGKKFDPNDTASALRKLPDVTDAFVLGIPAATGGQETCAAIATRTDYSEAEIKELLRGQLADFKIPRRIRCLPELPRNSAGKLGVPDIRAIFTMEKDQ